MSIFSGGCCRASSHSVSPLAHDPARLQVWAAAVLGEALRKRDNAATVTQAKLDYFLWKLAVARDAAGELPSFHRTRCTAY